VGSEIHTAASAGWKTPEREKLFDREKSTREIPSQRGEIVAIVITITPNFIGIIIIIISITPITRRILEFKVVVRFILITFLYLRMLAGGIITSVYLS
jgi:hypothetical protein